MAKITLEELRSVIEAHPKYYESWYKDVPAFQSMYITFVPEPLSDLRSEVYEMADGGELVLDFDRDGRVVRIEFV